jgi:HK97 family phage portal protein
LIGSIIRRLTGMKFRRNPVRIFNLPRTKFDFMSEVGDGTGSSTVMAPLLWIMRTFPEAPPMLWDKLPDGSEEAIRDHDLLRILRRPNDFYTGRQLWMATMTDWHVDGNAYWLKIRDRGGRVKQLWWVPHWMMEPFGDENAFITHYGYWPNGRSMTEARLGIGGGGAPIYVDPSEVVHFRFGLDPNNSRKGYAPLKSVLREVFTDDEAANFTASLLRNMGVPGIIMSPDTEHPPEEEDVKAMKAYIKANYGADNRGEVLVVSGPTKVQQFGFSPEQLMLKELRRIPEERVSAVLGVPAMVAGLGAGLERSTFTNYGEAREAAYEQSIIPSQSHAAEDIQFTLLPDFGIDPWTTRFGFDLSNVRALQGDVDALWLRLDKAVRGGWITRATAKRRAGIPVEAGDDVYIIPVNSALVDQSGKATSLAPAKQQRALPSAPPQQQ